MKRDGLNSHAERDGCIHLNNANDPLRSTSLYCRIRLPRADRRGAVWLNLRRHVIRVQVKRDGFGKGGTTALIRWSCPTH